VGTYFIAYVKNELIYQLNQIATLILRFICQNGRCFFFSKNASELLKSKEIRASVNISTDEAGAHSIAYVNHGLMYSQNQTSTLILRFICQNEREAFSKKI